MTKTIALIGAPVDLGAGRRGVDMGPSAIRYAGLRERLMALNYEVRDMGNIAVPMAEEIDLPAPNEKLRYLKPLTSVFKALADKVSEVINMGMFPLILGGDHSIALGSINGSVCPNANTQRKLGLLWIDAHGDFNTHETTPSGNIHGMPVAALTGRGYLTLTHLLGKSPILNERNVVLVGIRDLDPPERQALRDSRVHVFTMHDIDQRGMGEVMDEALSIAGRDVEGIHVSFDMDVLDPRDAPGVGTPVPGGISYREAHLAMELVADSARLVSLDLVEVNPILDTNNHTAKIAVELICSALGQRIF
jgi:arginase